MFDSSLFVNSIGLAPFKDCFRTKKIENGCKFMDPEPNFVLETLVSALSNGPIGPADVSGDWEKDLLMKTCRIDGLLLKTDRPAITLDRSFI